MATDPEASVLRVAAKLGLDDPGPVRRLLSAWWAWAGSLTARGELADSEVFLAQRDAEGLLELPLEVAARAIELEAADLHGLGKARRAARSASPRPRAAPADSGGPSPIVVGGVAFGTLLVLVVGGIGLGQVVRHVALPGGSSHATTAPYRAWIGILAGAGGALAALAAMRLRPASAEPLRLPLVGLVALGLFSLGLLAGASWLEWASGVLFAIVGVGAWVRTRLSGPA